MEPLEDDIATLKDLGLTTVQAKTYIALIKLDLPTISAIASLSHVPRTDLYRSIQELEKKGLVERIISNPYRFRAIPVDKCIDILYHRILEKNLEMQRNIVKLRKSLNQKTRELPETRPSSYVLVPKKRAIEKIGNDIAGTQASLEVVASWQRFSTAMFSFTEKVEKASSRGVKCRFITEKPKEVETELERLKSYQEKTNCKIKFIANSPQTVVSIYDRKEVIIIENPRAPLGESPVLWSNIRSLISMAKDFFEKLWRTAKENPYFKADLEPSQVPSEF